MTLNQFLLSDKRHDRVIRHVSLWMIYFLFCFFANIEIGEKSDLTNVLIYKAALVRCICFLPTIILRVYLFMYVLVPKFIQRKKYSQFVLAAIGITIGCFLIDLFSSYIFVRVAAPHLPPEKFPVWVFLIDWNMSMIKGLYVSGVATGLKLAKGRYLRQLENSRLAQKEAQHKLWLFRSQIQPEFLFHSLQSVYQRIDLSSEEAAEMILRLSDILSYILYECNTGHISLQKELSVVQELVALQKMNGGKEIRLTITEKKGDDNLHIVPLTLFSFVRNQISNNSSDHFITIDLRTTKNSLEMDARFKSRFPGLDRSFETNHVAIDANKTAEDMGYSVTREESESSIRVSARVELVTHLNFEDTRYGNIAFS